MDGQKQNNLDLDFSGLFGGDSNKETAINAPRIEQKGQGNTSYRAGAEKPVERRTESLEAKTSQKLVFDNAQAEEMYKRCMTIQKRYQENQAKAGKLQQEICNGIRWGMDTTILFLKAAELIGILTNDNEYRTNMESALIEVYGHRLGDAKALGLEMELVKARLERLENSASENQDEARAMFLAKAIDGHRQELELLETKIAEAKL